MNKIVEKTKGFLPYIFAAVVFILLAVIYCKPLLQGKVLQQGDIAQWKGMNHEIQQYGEQTGEVAHWTNSMFSGMPSYQINGAYHASSTTKVIDQVAKFFSDLTHLFFSSILALIIGYFVGFFILLRSFGVNKWISIIGAIAIAMSSYFFIIIVAGHETKAMTLGYMAPVMAGFFLIFRKRYLWGVPLVMLYTSIGLYRHPQMAYYIFMMIGICAIAEIFIHIREKRYKELIIGVVLFGGALLVGAGTGYSEYKANSEYLEETMRGGHSELSKGGESAPQLSSDSGLSLDYATQWSYGIDETMTLLIPNFKGGASSYNVGTKSKIYDRMIDQRVPAATATSICETLPTYWGTQPFTAGPVYIGAIICFLFVLGICIVKGPYKWALLISTLFSILLSWGHNMMWLTELFFNYFPMYNKFRTVSSILVVAEVAMPLLAFLALQAVISKQVTKEKLMKGIKISFAVTGGLCLIFALFGGVIYDFSSPNDAYMGLPQWLNAALLEQREVMFRADALRSLIFILLASALLWFFAKDKLKFKYFALVLAALVIADMWPVNKRFFNDDNFVNKKEDAQYFKMLPYEEAILQDPDIHFRVLNTTTNTFNESRTSYYLKSLGGYHAAKLRRYQDLIDEHLSKSNMNAYNMLNAKYFIINGEGGPTPVLNPEAMGNGWFVDSLIVVSNPNEESDALNSINIANVAVTDAAFKDFATAPVTPKDDTASIVLTSYTPNTLTYTTSSTFDKTAVFSEVYYPYGWKASIDGTPVDHFRVNYLLRALNIPAGDHEVVFEFRPDSIYKGYIVSAIFKLIMLLTILIALFIGLRRRFLKHRNTNLIVTCALLLITLSSCSESNVTKVIAHRGYWDCEGSAQNSIYALLKAGEIGVYGSEFDVNITPDSVLVINHDNTFCGYPIQETPYSIIKDSLLINGEKLPLLQTYLEVGKELPGLKMIFELKSDAESDLERIAIEKSIEMIKGLGVEKQVEFISFSLNACKEYARLMPNNQVAYLGGKYSPAELKEMGITALDYHFSNFQQHPEWVDQAHELGMKVNVWTVNKEEVIKEMLDLGVDYITTDKPELVQKMALSR